MTTELLLNRGAFIHLVRDSDEDRLFMDGHNTTPYEQYNPMGLRHVDTLTTHREYGYGVMDLYVFRDKTNTLWGVEMYRGLGKHDDYCEILQLADEITSLDLDPTETIEWEPLVLKELVRKTTYKYEVR